MNNRTWRDRLIRVIRESGKSMRSISIAAGQNETYVWELLNKGKEPTIGPLQSICTVLNVSVSYILEGVELSSESNRLLRVFARMPEAQKEAFLLWLESQKPR